MSDETKPILASPVTSKTPRTEKAISEGNYDGSPEWCPASFARQLELECAEWRRDAEALYTFLHACFPDVPTGTAMALANHEKLVSQHRQGRTE